MPAVTYYVVVPFSKGEEGDLVPGEPLETPNGDLARRGAQAAFAKPEHIGAVAFSCTGDPDSGEFADAVIIATFGEVDMKALQAED